MGRNDDKDEQGDHDSVSAMADRLKLTGKERSRYIHEHMTGLGYRMVPSYVRDDEDERDRGRSRYGLGRRERGSDRDRGSRDRDDDDYPF